MVPTLDYRYGKNLSSDFIKLKLNWDHKYWVKILKKLAKRSKLKQKRCYVCRGIKSKKVSNFYGISYLQCQKCSLVYGERRMPEHELTNYYNTDEDYFDKAYTDKNCLL